MSYGRNNPRLDSILANSIYYRGLWALGEMMYYEEKVIDGVLCFRTMPNSPFVQMTKEMLTTRIKKLEDSIANQSKPDLYEKAPWWANPDIPMPKITC